MTECIEELSSNNKPQSIFFKKTFWANLISMTSIVVAFFILWSVTIPNSTPLAFIFLFFVPIPFLFNFSLSYMRDDGGFIWVQPIAVLVFSIGFVWFFFSETSDHNYLQYPEYKQVILSDPDLKEYNEQKVRPDFNKLEADGVIMRYEMVQISDAMDLIRYKQKQDQNEVEKLESERRVKLIKESFGK